jgi:AcrR family transcriptional regulator
VPKVVDPDERRRVVVDALFAVVRREGMAGASVRAVAAEAGLSPGAMRHYVTSQGELLELAARAVGERVAARVGRHRSVEHLDDLVDLLGEIVPLDEERRAEAEVWLALIVQARTDERLAPLARATHDGLGVMVAAAVRAAAPDLPPPAIELEVDRLHALVDGLALHGVLQPDVATPERLGAALRAHLTELAALGGERSEKSVP